MPSRNETNPIPLRWTDGILIIMAILLLSVALVAQATQDGTRLLGGAFALLETPSAAANASNHGE